MSNGGAPIDESSNPGARKLNDVFTNSANTKLNRQATANNGSVVTKENKLMSFVGEQPLGMADS